MGDPQDDDPFTWDVERVVQELCTSNRTWKPTPRASFPDPTQLATRLRKWQYDGEVLLTALDNQNDLWADLDIEQTKLKMSIRTAIYRFRSKSVLYRAYKESISDEADEHTAAAGHKRPPSSEPQANGDLHRPGTAVPEGEAVQPPKKQRRLLTTDLVTVDHPQRDARFSAATILTEADAIIPLNMATQLTTPRFPPAQVLEKPNQPDQFQTTMHSEPQAYWGNGKLDIFDFLPSRTSVDDDVEFGWGRPKPFGRARKQFVSGQIKRYLRDPENFTKIVDDSESLLPAFGDSDEEDGAEWEEVRREMAEEQEEIFREQQLEAKSVSLSPAEVEEILRQKVEEYTARWQQVKLPAQMRGAFSLWSQAHRQGHWKSQILQLSGELRNATGRLNQLLDTLKSLTYSCDSELRHMTSSLEPTINEIELQKFKINILKSQYPPEKVTLPKKPKSAPKAKPLSDGYVDGIHGVDIWSDDDLDSFIVDDDDDDHNDDHHDLTTMHNNIMDDPMDIDRPPTSNSTDATISDNDSGPMFDLTEVGSSGTPVPLPAEADANNNDVSQQPNESGSNKLPLSEISAIASMGTQYWEAILDYERLIITLVYNWPPQRKEHFFGLIQASGTDDELWDSLMVQALQELRTETKPSSAGKIKRKPTLCLAWLFSIYTGFVGAVTNPLYKPHHQQPACQLDAEYIEQTKDEFPRFYTFLQEIAAYYSDMGDGDEAVGMGDSPTLDAAMDPTRRKEWMQRKKEARTRKLQLEEKNNSQAMEARRLKLRQDLEDSALVPKEKSRLIINETKEASKGLIFVHHHIAPHIKDHQVDGVRFLWNQITSQAENASGCLLAHTMGLGKTMQAITLMTAIAEAAKSEDPSISSQIPRHLGDSKFLVLCPPALIRNWKEELQRWAPSNIFGDPFTIEAGDSSEIRLRTAQAWADEGGVLLMGYSLLSQTKPSKRSKRTKEEEELEQARYLEVIQLLTTKASLVVADEAHYFKNPKSQTAKVVSRFETMSRVALTGSPLANNVLEYFAMIDWVAPGFLGDRDDFNKTYASVIADGLRSTSVVRQRYAKVLLNALKQITATKVQRKTIAMAKDTFLPPKTEYIISLKLSVFQQSIYQESVGLKRQYIEDLQTDSEKTQKFNSTSLWALTATLRNLLTHPVCYRKENDKTLVNADMPFEPSYQGGFDGLEDPLDFKHSPKMLVLDKILEESFALGDKVLVFSQSMEALNYIQEHVCRAKNRSYRRIDGHVDTRLRQPKVNNFNASSSPEVFLVSTTAGGVGMNMHGANRVVIFDFHYNPVHEQQAIGRAWRLGQKKPVFVYWLTYLNTFETQVLNLQTFKRQLAARVVDDQHPLLQPHLDYRIWLKDYEEPETGDTSAFRGEDSILDAALTSNIAHIIASLAYDDTVEEPEEDKILSADAQAEADQIVARHHTGSKAILLETCGENETNEIPQSALSEKVEDSNEPANVAATSSATQPAVATPTMTASLPLRLLTPEERLLELPARPMIPWDQLAAKQQQAAQAITNASQNQHGMRQLPNQPPHAHQQSRLWQGQPHAQAIPPQAMRPQGMPPQAMPPQTMPQQAPVYGPYQGAKRQTIAQFMSNLAQHSMWQQQQQQTLQPMQQSSMSDSMKPGRRSVTPAAMWPTSQPPPTTVPGVNNAQALNGNPMQDTLPSGAQQAAKPMTMQDAQERLARKDRVYEAAALKGLIEGLSQELEPALHHKLVLIVKSMDPYVVSAKMGELQMHQLWTRLRDVIKSDTSIIEAMESIAPDNLLAILNTAKKDKLAAILRQKARAASQQQLNKQDPDHAGQFLQRVSKESQDDSVNQRKSADAAAVHDIIRKRRSKSNKASTTPQQTPAPPIRPGSSATAPWVIDD